MVGTLACVLAVMQTPHGGPLAYLTPKQFVSLMTQDGYVCADAKNNPTTDESFQKIRLPCGPIRAHEDLGGREENGFKTCVENFTLSRAYVMDYRVAQDKLDQWQTSEQSNNIYCRVGLDGNIEITWMLLLYTAKEPDLKNGMDAFSRAIATFESQVLERGKWTIDPNVWDYKLPPVMDQVITDSTNELNYLGWAWSSHWQPSGNGTEMTLDGIEVIANEYDWRSYDWKNPPTENSIFLRWEVPKNLRSKSDTWKGKLAEGIEGFSEIQVRNESGSDMRFISGRIDLSKGLTLAEIKARYFRFADTMARLLQVARS